MDSAKAQTSTRQFIVTGATGFLGSHFVLRAIEMEHKVLALVRGPEAATCTARVHAALAVARQPGGEPPAAATLRLLSCIPADVTKASCAVDAAVVGASVQSNAEFWHIAASLQFEERSSDDVMRHNVDGTLNAITLAAALGCSRFVYVSTAYTAGRQRGTIAERRVPDGVQCNNAYERSKIAAERAVERRCQELGVRYSILRPSIIIGPSATKASGGSSSGLYGLLRELRRLRRLLNESERAISIRAEPETPINLIPVDHVVSRMLALSDAGFQAGPFYHIVNAAPPTVGQLLPLTCAAVGVQPIKLLREHQPTTPLEQLLSRRMEFYRSYLRDPKHFAAREPMQFELTMEDVATYLRVALAEKGEDAVEELLARSSLKTPDGQELVVYCSRNARDADRARPRPTVVLANAYGIPVDMFIPMIRQLAKHHQVLTWETRGLASVDQAASLDSAAPDVHVQDLVNLLEHHAVLGPVHLVGWCSGAHIVHRFARRHPDRAASVTLLNGSYYFDGVSTTAFQANIQTVMPSIARNAELAELYHATAYGKVRDRPAADTSTINTLLGGVDPALLAMTSAPFETPRSLFRYAALVEGLLRDGEELHAGEVGAPCLVLAGRRDELAHFEGALCFARRCKTAEVVLMEQGDHYSLFFDPFVARTVESFLKRQERRAD